MRFLPLLLLAGCIDFVDDRRREDPFDRYDRLPVGEGNVKVVIEKFEFDDEDRAAFDAAFAYRDRNVEIGGGGIFGSNGATVFAGTRDFVAGFRAATEKYRSRQYTKSFQIVADGYEAELHVVESVATPALIAIPVYEGTILVKTYQVTVTGTSLLVRPKRKGNLVDIDVTPVFADRKAGAVRITELSTRLTVEAGRPTVIMAHDERQDSFGGTFFTRRAGRSTRRIVQVLTVE